MDRRLGATLRVLDLDLAADLRERGGTLRVARLEDLDDTRQTVRDVRAGDTAGVERAHRQLRARLADRLRGDDADRVADLGDLARGEERSVARAAHAELAAALEHRANRELHLLRHVVVTERLDDLCDDRKLQLLTLFANDGLARLAARERLVDVVRERAAEKALVDAVGPEDGQLDG